jgi:hypothetical protein
MVVAVLRASTGNPALQDLIQQALGQRHVAFKVNGKK